MKRNSLIAVVFLAVSLCAPAPVGAEGYGDYFLYDPARIPEKVLKDTLGYVLLSPRDSGARSTAGGSWEKPPGTGEQKGPPYIGLPPCRATGAPAGDISAADTLPVGIGGYGGWVKYFVTARRGKCIQVVIHPYLDRRIWIRPNPDRGDLVIIPSELSGRDHPMDGEIELFLFTDQVRLYASPSPGAAVSTLHRDALPEDKAYYPIRFQRNWVRIGVRELDPETGSDTINGKAIGWIRIRDDSGRWAIHFFTYAWF